MHYSTRLRWIKPGLDEALGELREILSECTAEESRDDVLEQVRQSLARLRSTLELVSVYGAALLVEEMEAMAVALAKGRVDQREDGLRLLMQGVLQLPYYLERVQRSGQDIPILLMPLLNDIRALLRRRLLSETSLFSPDLTTRIPDLPPSVVAQGAISGDGLRAYAKRLRSYYQKGLVEWFRGEENSGLNTLAAVLRYLERLSGNTPLGTLWWIAAGVVAALRDGSLQGGVSVKLLMGQLDLQIRDLAAGGAEVLERPPPPELLKNLLFYVGRFRSGQQRPRRVREVYRLEDLLPEDDGGFLGPGLEVLDSVTEALSDDLARVKDVLDIFVRSEAANLETLRPTVGVLARVADTLALLGLGGARQTVMTQSRQLSAYLERGEKPDNEALMTIAGALLEVDAALSALASRGFDEALREEEGTAQVTALKDHEQRQVMAAAIGEVRVELVGIKEASEAYIATPESVRHLATAQEHFRRVIGGLTLLGLEPLAGLMQECSRYVRERLEANAPQLPAPAGLEAYAEAVMSTDYFLEGYLEGRVDTDEILDTIRASVEALELPPDVDVEEELDFDDNNEEIELAPPPPEAAGEEPLAAPEVDDELSFEEDSQEITLASAADEDWAADGDDEDESPAVMPPHLAASLVDASERLRRLDDGHGRPAEAAEPRAAVSDATPDQAASPPPPAAADEEAPDPEIVEIFLEEAKETLAAIAEQLELWRAEPGQRDALVVIRRGFHTLKGSGRLVGAVAVGELAWAVERLLNRLLDRALDFRPAMAELVAEAHGQMPAMVSAFQRGEEPPEHYRELIRRAEALAEGPPRGGDDHEPGDGEGGAGGPGGGAPGADDEPPSPATSAQASADADGTGVDAGVLKVFMPEAEGVLEGLQQACSRLSLAGGGSVDEALVRHCHTLKGITRLAALDDHSALYGALEGALDIHRLAQRPVSIEACAVIQESADLLAGTLAALGAGRRPRPPAADLVARARALAEIPVPAVAAGGGEEDELAAELREVFVEEAEEIQHACDQLVEGWCGADVDRDSLAELRRLLHTLKGGARMAELAPMVALSHALETLLSRLAEGRREPGSGVRDVVQHGLDGLAHMLDEVRAGRPLAEAVELVNLVEGAGEGPPPPPSESSPEAYSGEAPAPPSSEPPPETVGEPAPPAYEVPVVAEPPVVSLVGDDVAAALEREGVGGVEKVNVGVDLLDHLVSTSGEISISRSRLEQQVGEVSLAIKEMDQTISRLRSQLRRLEIETESQILFRHERAAEDAAMGAFDPLELDRYTEVQELSRGLTESVSDLVSIQGQLTDLVRDSETFLLQQARLSSDLQERLLTTRMVSFARYIPRLRRLTRQTAKELHKQVELHVRGQDEELDHTIIGPVVGALEHLLNNAVDHGIEAPDLRRERGKSPTGRIELALERDHNDVVIRLADDGTGMDLEAIRRQAVERGLLDEQVEVSDDELVQFVFEQAFSTAGEVTRISGRGVGLDVVNAAIHQLSGSLAVDTTAGTGTTFTIRLPTTISVSQALMILVDEEQFALPLSHLEGVMQLARDQVEALLADEQPRFQYLGDDYPLYPLGHVLGTGDALPAPNRRCPLLFVRVGDRRMAFVVDGLGSRQEIVVKPVGPQVGTLSWVLGATIAGDGRVVLVIDLPGLVRLAATQPVAVARRRHGGAAQEGGRPPLVMVVDDSLTVRRVAERFLERNGMEVLTARDGVEALALLQEHAPDVMLLDIEMPRMDGYELATSIRNDERLRRLPIIMITSRSGHKHAERARTIGVNHYMNKPYQEGELLAQIHALTGAGHG